MPSNLKDLSALLCKEIEYNNLFRIPYLRINARGVLRERFETADIELNDLTDYTWRKIEGEERTELLIFIQKNTQVIKEAINYAFYS